MRPDDDAVADTIAGDARKRVRHERRRLADRDDAQRLPLQPRGDADETDGAIDQVVWRRSFDRRACNGQDVLAKIGQGENLSERSWDRSSPTVPSRR